MSYLKFSDNLGNVIFDSRGIGEDYLRATFGLYSEGYNKHTGKADGPVSFEPIELRDDPRICECVHYKILIKVLQKASEQKRILDPQLLDTLILANWHHIRSGKNLDEICEAI